MTTSSLRIALAGAALVMHLGSAAAQPAAISFDTTPRAGQHQRQLMDMQMLMKTRVEAGPNATEEQLAKVAQAQQQMAQMGQMKMGIRMEQTLKVGQPDPQGWLPMTVAMVGKGGQIEVGGNQMALPQDKKMDMSVDARFNPKDFAFEITQVQGAAGVDEMLRTKGAGMLTEALQLAKVLSQRPLKVGESVDVPMSMALPMPIPGGAGKMDSKVRYTLKRVDRGLAYFDLAMDMQIDANTPLPTPAASAASAASAADASPAAPQAMNMQLSGTGKGSSTLRLADRLALNTQLDMDMKMQMQVPDASRVFMDMQVKIQSKGETVGKPAAAPAKKKS